jgi:hypothetical protein
MSIYTCEICNKNFSSALGLAGHKRMHGKSNGFIQIIKCCCVITQREIIVRDLIKFQNNLKNCLYCNSILKNNQPKFCNNSCAASYNNKDRIKNGYTITHEHRIKTSNTLKSKDIKGRLNTVNKNRPVHQQISKTKKTTINKKSAARLNKNHVCGEYSIIFYKKCSHCSELFCSRKKRKYCSSCAPLYEKTYKQRFKFTFNVYKYPNLFDLDYIKRIGWYSRGGTAGKWNPDGLTRDHRVSITDAIKNNYDPFYISHPLNCEIMSWTDNNKKKSKSSLSYDELVKLVDNYEYKN